MRNKVWLTPLANGAAAETRDRQDINGVIHYMISINHGSDVSLRVKLQLLTGAHVMCSIQSEDGTVLDNVLVSATEKDIVSARLAEYLVQYRDYVFLDNPAFRRDRTGTSVIVVKMFLVHLFREPDPTQGQREYINGHFNHCVALDTGLPGGPSLASQLSLSDDVIEKWIHSPARRPLKTLKAFKITIMFNDCGPEQINHHQTYTNKLETRPHDAAQEGIEMQVRRVLAPIVAAVTMILLGKWMF
ncbi:hypothetical protein QCA50_019667 [Cerrena zonata]|uniref:Uncharacterized protein n=1 Tax=Cerrena zonata TaxID=2478898 RepID=A0AAW0FJF9_9APHY